MTDTGWVIHLMSQTLLTMKRYTCMARARSISLIHTFKITKAAAQYQDSNGVCKYEQRLSSNLLLMHHHKWAYPYGSESSTSCDTDVDYWIRPVNARRSALPLQIPPKDR